MPSLSGSAEVPCARCSYRDPGLTWGALCHRCLAERKAFGNRWGRRAALVGAALTTLYVWLRVPMEVPLARTYGIIAIPAVYIIVYRIASKLAQEFFR